MSLLSHCHLLLQNVQEFMENIYPKLINMERAQRQWKTYRAFLQDAVQEVSSIYQSLNGTKH